MLLLAGLLASSVLLATSPGGAQAVPIGLQFTSFTANQLEWEAIDRSGAQLYRLNATFKYVADQGDWRQSPAWEQTYDKIFERAAHADITILPDFYGRKTGGAHKHFYLWGNTSGENAEWQEFMEFVWTFVQRYGRGGTFWDQHPSLPYKPATAWEVWNEPNLPENNPGGEGVLEQKYAEFLIATSSTIKTAQDAVRDPGEPNDIKVLHGGLYQPDSNLGVYIEKASKVSGYAGAFEALSLHPYSFNGDQAEKLVGLANNLDWARDLLDIFVGGGKSIWVTELGWPVAGAGQPSVSETEQASLLTHAFNFMQSKAGHYNIGLITWYLYRDLDINHWAYNTGLRRADGTYRPSWWAFRAQAGLSGPPPQGKHELSFVRYETAPDNTELNTYVGTGYGGLASLGETGFSAVSDPENVQALSFDRYGDGIDELGFLRYDSGSGKTHLNAYYGAPDYGTSGSDCDTGYPAATDPENVEAVAVDTNADGRDALGFLRFNHASGNTRLSIYGGPPCYQTFVYGEPTGYPAIADPENVQAVMIDSEGDGRDELAFVRLKGSGTNKAVISLYGGPTFSTGILTCGTGYPDVSDPENIKVIAIDLDGNGVEELGFVRYNTWTGKSHLDAYVKPPCYDLLGFSADTGYPAVSDPKGVEAIAIDSIKDPAPGAWYTDDLGGDVTSDPDIASWGPDHLHVFAKGDDDSLVHKWWAGSGWSSWESLGGSLTSGPGAVAWGQGRLDVVARTTNNSVKHWYWGGSSWASDNLGGTITSAPDIASWGSNHLHIFARGADNALWHKWWAGAGWSSWHSLGGSLASGPSAVSWGQNRIDVVARTSSGSVQHWFWNGLGWGSDNLGGNIASDPDIASWGSNHLHVFAKGTNGRLVQKWWSGAGWSGWHGDMEGTVSSGPGAVAGWGVGRVDVVARTPDDSVQHWYWQDP